jgi:hypothetical protein
MARNVRVVTGSVATTQRPVSSHVRPKLATRFNGCRFVEPDSRRSNKPFRSAPFAQPGRKLVTSELRVFPSAVVSSH